MGAEAAVGGLPNVRKYGAAQLALNDCTSGGGGGGVEEIHHTGLAGPLHPAASGVKSRRGFCDFGRIRPFPEQKEAILLRGGLFRPWETSGFYLPISTNATLLRPDSWITAVFLSAPKWMGRGGGGGGRTTCRPKLQSYMFASHLLTVGEVSTISTDSGKAAFPTSALIIRVPSDAM